MRTMLKNLQTQKQIGLMSVDSGIIALSFIVAYLFRVAIIEHNNLSIVIERLSWFILIAVLLHLIAIYIFDLYNIDNKKPLKIMLLQMHLSVGSASGVIAVLCYLFPEYKLGRTIMFIHVLMTIWAMTTWRLIFFALNKERDASRKLLMLGHSPICDEIKDFLSGSQVDCYSYKGCITEYSQNPGVVLDGILLKKSLHDIAIEKKINTIVVAHDIGKHDDLRKELMRLKFKGLSIYDALVFYKELMGKVPVSHIDDSWFLFCNQGEQFMPKYWQNIKRILDIFFSCLFMLLLLPFYLLIAAAIKIDSKGPILFKQERLGFHEKPFFVLKFRTMVENAEKVTGPKWSSVSDPRITRVGRILRKLRLDELPQFINVIRGEMSIVGPRPIRKYFADRLAEKFPFYHLRFLVKPGLTGWAQVKGDYAGSEDGQFKKLQYDLYYIQHQSIIMDLFILLKTVQTIIAYRGE